MAACSDRIAIGSHWQLQMWYWSRRLTQRVFGLESSASIRWDALEQMLAIPFPFLSFSLSALICLDILFIHVSEVDLKDQNQLYLVFQ